jgi:hypothetical protein
LCGTSLALYIARQLDHGPFDVSGRLAGRGPFLRQGSDTLPYSGHDKRYALPHSTIKPATWFELVPDTQLIAFSQPLLTVFSQATAVGELVGGPLDGTPVLIRTRPAPPVS